MMVTGRGDTVRYRRRVNYLYSESATESATETDS